MALELEHIILAVDDRARSIAFYTGILGLDPDRHLIEIRHYAGRGSA